ncbi:hypothetical protein GCM10010261_29960 [Streptomyces pilosus]|uniref:Secreted protein n=1 Tax=Streptomyces pilosus TaxID=28893 RepID=A0A918BQA9_9ACTN|nr:hypothetical protein GCM10010280_32940 [Streptomyces pilosus]GGV50937.1 hypothetical protein GCM10010261_29960 [Streptomyces pilosus]
MLAGALGDLVLGLLASCLSGLAVWLWQRGRHNRDLRLRMRVVGARPGDTCLIVMNNKYGAPGTTHHHDVQAMIEAAVLSHGLRCEVEVVRSDDFRGGNGEKPEFCIGGPLGSNVRSAGHVAHSLPGVTFHPYDHPDHPLAIEAGGVCHRRDSGNEEYVLLAKFTAPGGERPVVLICGQTALTNHAAAYFLRRSYRRIADTVASTDRFCLLLKVPSIGTYGFQGVVLERDLTDVAFTRGA